MDISLICCTYGRAKHLPVLLESFLRQDYALGKLELLIVNDVAEQTFQTDVPRVRIVNHTKRFLSMGEKKSWAMREAAYDTIVNVDDDDALLPWFVSSMQSAAAKVAHPCWPTSYLACTGVGIKTKVYTVHGLLDGIGWMTKAQFAQLGDFITTQSLIDRNMFDRATAIWGDAIRLPPIDRTYGYIYRWDNGVFHLSGDPTKNAYVESASTLKRRMAARVEPSGIIKLRPRWDADFLTLAEAFFASAR